MTDLWTEKNVIWVVDTTLLEGTVSEKLPDVIRSKGLELITFCGPASQFDLMDIPNRGWMDEGSGPIVAYGSQQFISKVISQPWYPGAYPNSPASIERLNPIRYMTDFDNKDLLNNDYIFASISEVIRNSEFFFKLFQIDQLFIKDNAAFKSIPAKVLTRENIVSYLTLYRDTHFIENHELVLVSTPKTIVSEHRFVIVSGDVIAHSTYMSCGVRHIVQNVPKSALEFAKRLANTYPKIEVTPEEDTKPVGCYTMDIAMQEINGEIVPKLLELNSFSCADLYACDLNAVVDAVTKKALLDYKQGPASYYQ